MNVVILSFLEFNDISQLNNHTRDTWEAAVEKFERKLQPAEDLIAGKLRNLINRKKSNTTEVRDRYLLNTFFFSNNK